VFGEDGSLAGNAGCNNYFSSFTTDGDQIQIAPAGSTMMMCAEPEGLMEQEAAYLTALTTAATYSIRGDQLELRTADGALAVSYTATPPAGAEAPAEPASAETGAPALEGTNWLLESYAGADGQATAALADVQVTALFADGRVGGSGGCNNYGGPYTVDGSGLTVGPLASTMMACMGPVMDQETAYLSALQSAASYAVVDGKLQISDAAGQVVLIYGVQVLPTLTGTTWYATGVNNGREAVVSLVTGSEITAVFGEDGSLTGRAGCNNYMTSYTTASAQIQIEPAASTRMMCPEPEGVMEQEAAYLAALTTAATYSISGDRLELRTADGALAVGYSATPPAAPEEAAAPAAEAPAAPAGTVPLPAELLNATYTVPDIGTITLQDGKYEDAPNQVVVTILPYAAEGELDGVPSTAVILVANTGGSGVFYYLAVMQEQDGGWVNVATTLLGDRVDIQALAIENNQVVVEMVTQGPDDPMCCATTIVRRTYELKDGELVMTSDEIIGKVES
jgi:heat shock protein HslJ